MQATTGLRRFNRNHTRLTALIIGIAALLALASAVAYLWNDRSASEQTSAAVSVTSGAVRAHYVPSAGEGMVGGLDSLPVAALESHHVSGAGEGFIGGFGSPAGRSAPAPYVPYAGEGIIGGFNTPLEDVLQAHHTPGAGEGLLGGFGQ